MPEWHASFEDPTTARDYAAIDAPTLLLVGTESRRSTRSVAKLLASTMRSLQGEEIAGVGHMAPVTHPERVNALIERHLAKFEK